MVESGCSEMSPGICLPLSGFPLFSAPLLQTEFPAAQGAYSPIAEKKNPRAHSYWMGLGHVPIPEPIPGPISLRQADGRGLCHRIPSEAGKWADPKAENGSVCLSRGTQGLLLEEGVEDAGQTLPLAWRSTLQAPWALGKVKSLSSSAFLLPGDFLPSYK